MRECVSVCSYAWCVYVYGSREEEVLGGGVYATLCLKGLYGNVPAFFNKMSDYVVVKLKEIFSVFMIITTFTIKEGTAQGERAEGRVTHTPHTDTQTHRHTDTHRHTQRDTHKTNRQTQGKICSLKK